MNGRIELVTGAAPWLLRLQLTAVLAAACALLTAPSPWVWRFAAVGGLALFALVAWRKTAGRPPGGELVLNLDGRLRVSCKRGATDGLLDGGAWVSPWFCVLHWTSLAGGARQHSLVCASLNHPDDYRRLAVWVRLGAFSGSESLHS